VAENVLEDGCEEADPLPLPFNPTRIYILLLIIIFFTYFCDLVIFNRQKAKENIIKYVDERLPEEYEKCLVGLNNTLKEAWKISQDDSVRSDKIRALSQAKECYAMKLELLTNATVVDDVIKFARQQQKPLSSMDTVSNGSKENKEDKEKSRKGILISSVTTLFVLKGLDFVFDINLLLQTI
jgi:hypothetical protein